MTYIPDCRTDKNYNKKYLNKQDAEFVKGFDWCTEVAVDSFFDNLDIYFELDNHVMHILNEKLPEELKDEYTLSDSEFVKREKERTVETYSDLIRMNILHYIEMERDEMITSMIDGMDEEERNKIKAEVDANENV